MPDEGLRPSAEQHGEETTYFDPTQVDGSYQPSVWVQDDGGKSNTDGQKSDHYLEPDEERSMGGFVTEFRLYNRYRWERVPTQDPPDQEEISATATPPLKRNENGLCWDEKEIRTTVFKRWKYVLFRWYELWETDLLLEKYIDLLTGWESSVLGGAMSISPVTVTATVGGAEVTGAAAAVIAAKAGAGTKAALAAETVVGSTAFAVTGATLAGAVIGGYIAKGLYGGGKLIGSGWVPDGWGPSTTAPLGALRQNAPPRTKIERKVASHKLSWVVSSPINPCVQPRTMTKPVASTTEHPPGSRTHESPWAVSHSDAVLKHGHGKWIIKPGDIVGGRKYETLRVPDEIKPFKYDGDPADITDFDLLNQLGKQSQEEWRRERAEEADRRLGIPPYVPLPIEEETIPNWEQLGYKQLSSAAQPSMPSEFEVASASHDGASLDDPFSELTHNISHDIDQVISDGIAGPGLYEGAMAENGVEADVTPEPDQAGSAHDSTSLEDNATAETEVDPDVTPMEDGTPDNTDTGPFLDHSATADTEAAGDTSATGDGPAPKREDAANTGVEPVGDVFPGTTGALDDVFRDMLDEIEKTEATRTAEADKVIHDMIEEIEKGLTDPRTPPVEEPEYDVPTPRNLDELLSGNHTGPVRKRPVDALSKAAITAAAVAFFTAAAFAGFRIINSDGTPPPVITAPAQVNQPAPGVLNPNQLSPIPPSQQNTVAPANPAPAQPEEKKEEVPPTTVDPAPPPPPPPSVPAVAPVRTQPAVVQQQPVVVDPPPAPNTAPVVEPPPAPPPPPPPPPTNTAATQPASSNTCVTQEGSGITGSIGGGSISVGGSASANCGPGGTPNNATQCQGGTVLCGTAPGGGAAAGGGVTTPGGGATGGGATGGGTAGGGTQTICSTTPQVQTICFTVPNR